MFTFMAASGHASNVVWERFAAGQALTAAVDALDAAGAALVSLVVETAWDADGVRALNTKLLDIQAIARSEALQLRVRRWELDAIVAS